MKVMFISDLHGSYYWANKAIEKYHEEKADKLIILGDILYHGPRNDLPKDYNCKKVIALLNPLKKDIIAVRGNCDSEVDQMVLDFPMRSDYALMDVDQHHFFMTHGHLFNEDKLPWLQLSDLKGIGKGVARQYNIQAIPQTYILDAENKVIAVGLRGKALEETIDKAMQ